MSNASTSKTDTFDALAKKLTGVVAGIKANLAASKSITLGGNSVTVTKVTSDFQGMIDTITSVDAAKTTLAQQVKGRLQQKTEVEAELAQFTQWAVVTYGEAAYGLFGLPPPKPKKTSPSKKAIGVAKMKATLAAKAAAKAASAPKEETLVAFDANGNPIGNGGAASAQASVPAPSTSTAPAPAASTTPAATAPATSASAS